MFRHITIFFMPTRWPSPFLCMEATKQRSLARCSGRHDPSIQYTVPGRQPQREKRQSHEALKEKKRLMYVELKLMVFPRVKEVSSALPLLPASDWARWLWTMKKTSGWADARPSGVQPCLHRCPTLPHRCPTVEPFPASPIISRTVPQGGLIKGAAIPLPYPAHPLSTLSAKSGVIGCGGEDGK